MRAAIAPPLISRLLPRIFRSGNRKKKERRQSESFKAVSATGSMRKGSLLEYETSTAGSSILASLSSCDYNRYTCFSFDQSKYWHTASSIYIVILFVIGVLMVVMISLFHGGREKTSRRKLEKNHHKSATRSGAGGRERGIHVNTERLAGGVFLPLSPSRCTNEQKEEEDVSIVSDITIDYIMLDDLLEGELLNNAESENGGKHPKQHHNKHHEHLVEKEVPKISPPPLFPSEATEAEVSRFVRAQKGDLAAGAKQFRHYLEWRQKCQEIETMLQKKTTMDGDGKKSGSDQDWDIACTVALAAADDPECLATSLPCVVFLHDEDGDEDGTFGASNSGSTKSFRSLEGYRICQHVPARIETNYSAGGASGQTYATALAIYLDRRLSRTSQEKFDLFIDVRPGMGWANINAIQLVPFIKHASRLLNELHPERLHRAVVYPVPFVAAFVWNRLLKPFMDPSTADEVWVFGGGGNRVKDKVPKRMMQLVDEDVLDEMERRRLHLFS